MAVVGFLFAGWQGFLTYVAGRVPAGVVNGIIGIIDAMNAKRIRLNAERFGKQVGISFTMSEMNFFTAYIYHARRETKSLNLAVSDEELDESNWQPVFMDLAAKWPQIPARFTPAE